jgi:hypothetical protein
LEAAVFVGSASLRLSDAGVVMTATLSGAVRQPNRKEFHLWVIFKFAAARKRA